MQTIDRLPMYGEFVRTYGATHKSMTNAAMAFFLGCTAKEVKACVAYYNGDHDGAKNILDCAARAKLNRIRLKMKIKTVREMKKTTDPNEQTLQAFDRIREKFPDATLLDCVDALRNYTVTEILSGTIQDGKLKPREIYRELLKICQREKYV